MAGRNPNLSQVIIRAIVEVMKTRKTTYAQAAGFTGIPKSTAMLWMQKGREADARRDLTAKERLDQGLPTAAKDSLYLDLLDQTEQARYDAILSLQDALRASVAEDPRYWQGYTKYLTALDRETWGEKSAVELTGANGGPVETRDLSADALQKRVAGLLAVGLVPPAPEVVEDESVSEES